MPEFSRDVALELMMATAIDQDVAEALWDSGPAAILFYYQNRPHLPVSEYLVVELLKLKKAQV